MILPIGLSPFYPLPKYPPLQSLENIVSIILVLVISFFCTWAWKRGSKVYTVLWAYYVITLLPVIGIIQLGEQAAADRYSYMPGIGPFFLIGLGISYAWGKNYSSKRLSSFCKKIILFMLILIFLTLSILTVKQTKIWTDSITLWSYELKGYPDFWLAYYIRSKAYIKLGDYQQALKDLDKVIELKSEFIEEAHRNKCEIYKKLDDHQQAI